MEESKFADLDRDQLQKLNELEDKLGVTLIAYDTSGTLDNSSAEIPPS